MAEESKTKRFGYEKFVEALVAAGMDKAQAIAAANDAVKAGKVVPSKSSVRLITSDKTNAVILECDGRWLCKVNDGKVLTDAGKAKLARIREACESTVVIDLTPAADTKAA